MEMIHISSCPMTDIACICADECFKEDVQICVEASCNVTDKLGEQARKAFRKACYSTPLLTNTALT